MRRFAHAAIVAVAISAPVLTGVLMDHSVVSVLGSCKTSCTVGGADPNNPGNAQGGRSALTVTVGGVTLSGSASGTLAVPGGQQTGHTVGINPINPAANGTASGNFTDPNNPKGHCTGGANFTNLCS
jgi:hypothetical protein